MKFLGFKILEMNEHHVFEHHSLEYIQYDLFLGQWQVTATK